jgi:hypothetical protein
MNTQPLYNINLFEQNVLVNQISDIEKHNVYGSLPAYIYQNASWVTQSQSEINRNLEIIDENTDYRLAYNLTNMSYLTISKKHPEHVNILIQNTHNISGAIKRTPSCGRINTPLLPLSDDDDKNIKSLDYLDNACIKYVIYFIEKYIISFS